MNSADRAAERRFPSPLRYPGGKGKISNYMKVLFIRNDLVGREYAEVYAGGASVALSLLFEDYASHIHINDLDPGVHAFWQAVLKQTEPLCRLIRDTPVSVEEWYRQQQIQDAVEPSPLELAFSTFFLNRTNRSGIIQGGVIGGQEQTGKWKIDARYNKKALTRRIEKISRHAGRITLTRRDGAEYLREVVPTLPPGTFLYLDPPYFVKGGSRLYTNYYEDHDHVEVGEAIQAINDRPWVVSYDRVGEILDLYEGVDRIEYGLSYSAADRYRGREVMFFSDGLRQPENVETPARLNNTAVREARRVAAQA